VEKTKEKKEGLGSSQRGRQRGGRDRVDEGTEEVFVQGYCEGENGGKRERRRGRQPRDVAVAMKVDYVWRMLSRNWAGERMVWVDFCNSLQTHRQSIFESSVGRGWKGGREG
jgi:hypothetical protein